MNYQEALAHKKESLKNADKNVLDMFHLVIAPANTDDAKKFMDDYLKKPNDFDDKSCKKYCSDDEYEVMSFKKEN